MKGFSQLYTRFLAFFGTRVDAGSVTDKRRVVPEVINYDQANELDSAAKSLDPYGILRERRRQVTFDLRGSSSLDDSLTPIIESESQIIDEEKDDPNEDSSEDSSEYVYPVRPHSIPYEYSLFRQPAQKTSKWILPGNFVLRDLDLEEYGYQSNSWGARDAERMKLVLFAPGFDPVIEDDWFRNQFYNLLTDSDIYGPKPPLPFTLVSFIDYLFERSKDLQVIRIMLQLCQKDPNILMSYDRKLQDEEHEYGVREEMLLFLIKIRQCDEEGAGKKLLQLMGFKNMATLKIFYRDNALMEDAIQALESDNDQDSDSEDVSIIYNFE